MSTDMGKELHAAIRRFPKFQPFGRLHGSKGMLSARIPATTHELCRIETDHEDVLAEVVGVDDGYARLLTYDHKRPISNGATVVGLGHRARVPRGRGLLGRVLDGLGEPMDGLGSLQVASYRDSVIHVPPALSRKRIVEPLHTGQKAIDGLLTVGVGQRVGLFAGSGVGKSTLLGEIAKYSNVDLNVIALIGERGREVRPFIEDCLGKEGRERSVVIVSTSDESPLMRIRAVQTAITIADDFRRQGGNVLLLLDSLTRMAAAQREIGLSLGEPPTARGYTPSVFQMLASTLEQLGNSDRGSITAFLTVLVDGDDMNDPIADSVRSIVDGHIVLSRALAERNQFPAIDVGNSISRVFLDVTNPQHQLVARELRATLAMFYENVDLIRAGAYQPGSSPEIDQAIQLTPRIEAFLRQSVDEFSTFDATLTGLHQLLASTRTPAL